MPAQTVIKFRRDTEANWTSADPTLAAGEAGFESDTGKLKIGDGSTAWSSLGYISGGASVEVSDTAPASPEANTLWWESDTGTLFIYYDGYWVEAITGTVGPSGADGADNIVTSATAPANTDVLWIDTSEAGDAVLPLGGTTGQVLEKASASDYDTQWVDATPITAQGDLIVGDASGDETRLSIGTAGKVLTSNGTTASWEDAAGGVSLTNAVILIMETQSVTLASPHFAICLGGGGAGGGILAGADQAGAGGGGSGYLATGTVAAGTYTATVGAGGLGVSEADGGNGGTTSISTVSASGGDGGQAVTVTGTAGNGGNGGSGGAPGIVSAVVVGTSEANIGGYNGGDAEIIYTGTSGTAGTSSGVTAESFGALGYIFVQPALFGTNYLTSAGNYAAGGGGVVSSSGAVGASTTAFGAGGGGSRGDTAVAAAQIGGDAGNGIIILVEL